MKKITSFILTFFSLILVSSFCISFMLVISGVHTPSTYEPIWELDHITAVSLFVFCNYLLSFACVGLVLSCSGLLTKKWQRKSMRANYLGEALLVIAMVIVINIIGSYTLSADDSLFYGYSSGMLAIAVFILSAHHGDVIANNYKISSPRA